MACVSVSYPSRVVLQQELLASQPTGDTEKDRERQRQIDEFREKERIRKEKISAYNKERNMKKKLVRLCFFLLFCCHMFVWICTLFDVVCLL